jgi:receptor protein-tyrosine kinase
MNTIEKALDKLAAGHADTPTSTPHAAIPPAGQNDAANNAMLPTSPEQVSTVAIPELDTAQVQTTAIQAALQATIQPVEQTAQQTSDSSTASETAKRNYAHIDLERLAEQNFVAIATERKQIYEEYRVIKRKLINNAFGALSSTLHHPNLILVTSTRPGEGKTFTSINLALSIALEQDKTVLLVDADVLRPNVSRTLGVKHPVGLTDYLSSDKYQVSDILLSTNVERLKVITAGRPHHLSTELLASDKMLELVAEFASRYRDRIVIFDAPPLLGVNETAVVAGMCGQAVVVLEENATRLHELEKALSLLPQDLAVGFVMNKSRQSLEQGYGYGYYARNQ